jgi:hypothetical protein
MNLVGTVIVWGLIGVTAVLLGTVLWRLPGYARVLAAAVRDVQTALRTSPNRRQNTVILGTLLVAIGAPCVMLMAWLLPRWAWLVNWMLAWIR